MLSRIRERLTYANVVATLALVVALAAAKNSVTSKSIKAGNVTARDLAGAVLVTETVPLADPNATDDVYTVASAIAKCPRGARVITGGGGSSGNTVALQSSAPSGANAWFISAASNGGFTTELVATALCLPKSPAKPYRDPAKAAGD
jgi:hypothetical protein